VSRRSVRAIRPAAEPGAIADVFRHTLRVRYSECDLQGVVFNANYVAYFDVIITELWREALGRYSDLLDHNADMVVGEVNVRYLGPAGFDDELDFEARLTRVGETAISTRIDVATSGRPVVEGRMRHVFIEPKSKAKRPMPDHVREALLRYLDEDAA
jgi:acyl-CoA thioester hydrolase